MKMKHILLTLVLISTLVFSVGCGRRMNSATDGTDKKPQDTTVQENNSSGNTSDDSNVVDGVMDGVEDTVDGVIDGVNDVVNGGDHTTNNSNDTTPNDTNVNETTPNTTSNDMNKNTTVR